MLSLPPDPLGPDGIAGYARAIRQGSFTVQDAVAAWLQRIEALDSRLRAYEYVDADGALRAAHAIDRLLAAGTDLGPLMGLAVAVKDVMHVRGMPTRVGSNVDVQDLVGEEGSFVRRLRELGCIILGKTQTVEFAIGSTGTNYRRGTPRNPCDPQAFRVPAGSSSGSAVAMAAGLCGMAIGTDTGGSVRGPAAFCGVFGLKLGRDAVGRDGMFEMSRSFDSIGLLTASATDAALAWQALSGQVVQRMDVRQLRLGRPTQYFFDDLQPEVAACTEAALQALQAAGARIEPVQHESLSETDALYTTVARWELMQRLGRERFQCMRAQLNPDVEPRIAMGLSVDDAAYHHAQRRRGELTKQLRAGFAGLDGWAAPVKQHLPPLYAGDFPSPEEEAALAARCNGPTRPANVFEWCAASLPIGQWAAPLPVGLQLMRPAGGEASLLALAMACESVLGPATRPDMNAWLPARPKA